MGLGFANPAPKPNSNSNQDEFDVQKEAAWVLANVMHGYQSDPSLHAANRVRTLVQMGCLGASPEPEPCPWPAPLTLPGARPYRGPNSEQGR